MVAGTNGIFRNRGNTRTVLQPQAAGVTSAEIRNSDDLLAAIGAAVDVETGTSDGKVIVLPVGTLVLTSPIVLGDAQSGLTFIGQSTTLFMAGVGPIVDATSGLNLGVTFEGVNFRVELSSGSNACVVGSGLVGPFLDFFRCEFRGARHSVLTTAQSTVNLLLCRDFTGDGSSIANANARYIGNRVLTNVGIVVTGGAPCSGNVIDGNAMLGGTIDTSASGGLNSIAGNTRVTIVPAGTDAVGLNT